MKITMIIPAYNRARFLPHAVNSILRQDGDFDIDILIVDDGSTDDTPAVIADIMAHHPHVRTVRQDNGGISAARNAGLKNLLPETEIVTFLDSDDILTRGRMAGDVPRLVADPDLDLTYGRMLMTDALDYDAGLPKDGARVAAVCGIHLCSALLRRRVVERVGLFDETLKQSEDTDYLFRIFESGFKWEQVETVCFCYYKHDTNITLDRKTMQHAFGIALVKSMKRRRADPTRIMIKPTFDLTPM